MTNRIDRLLNTIRQGDYYLITDDFDSCESRVDLCRRFGFDDHPCLDLAALRMVDAAYADRTEWIKKSIRTTAKVIYLFPIYPAKCP